MGVVATTVIALTFHDVTSKMSLLRHRKALLRPESDLPNVIGTVLGICK